jgi:hypothetical protein
MNEKLISEIKRHGKTAKGKKELIKHLEGGRLTLRQAVNAYCYSCLGYYADGKQDCKMPHCSLNPFMPYNKNREKRTAKKSTPGDHMEKMRTARL